MYTSPQIGNGTILSYSNTSGGTFSPVAYMTDIKPRKRVMTPVDIERYDNATATIERIPSWINPGEIEATIYYLSAEAATIAALFGQLLFWKVTLTDGFAITSAGIMVEEGLATPKKTEMTQEIKISLSGAATIVAAA